MLECDCHFSGCRFWKQSPGHHSSTTFFLGPLVSEIGNGHILHGDPPSLLYGDLAIAKSACLPTKSHCPESCSHGEIQAREFAATNRSRLKSIQRLDKKSMPSCQTLRQFAVRRIIAYGRHMGTALYPLWPDDGRRGVTCQAH